MQSIELSESPKSPQPAKHHGGSVQLLLVAACATQLCFAYQPALGADSLPVSTSISHTRRSSIGLLRESQTLVEERKFAEAEPLLKELVKRTPDDLRRRAILGAVLLKLSRPADAVAHLEYAVDHNTDDEGTWLELASTYASLGRQDDAHLIYQCFLKRFPNSPQRGKVLHLKAALEREQDLFRKRTSDGKGAQSAGVKDYYTEAIGPQAERWPFERMPLTVFIKPGNGLKGYRPTLEGIFKQSFKDWEDASRGRITVRFVGSPSEAVVIGSWAGAGSGFAKAAKLGETATSRVRNSLVRASIRIRLTNDSGSPLPEAVIRETCLHEIGHALGIQGHSPHPDDIMYYSDSRTRQASGISPRDTATLLKLYASSNSISDCTRRLHDEAVELLNRGEYPAAKAAFEQVLALAPDLEVARTNLGLCYAGSAMKLYQEKRYEEAERVFAEIPQFRKASSHPELFTPGLKAYAGMLRELGRNSEAADIEKLYSDNEPVDAPED